MSNCTTTHYCDSNEVVKIYRIDIQWYLHYRDDIGITVILDIRYCPYCGKDLYHIDK